MFAANTGNGNFGIFVVLIIVIAICVGAFKLWMIVARPEVYRAQLDLERQRREQRNALAGSALGSGFKLLGMFLNRRR